MSTPGIVQANTLLCLNESPYEKVGKYVYEGVHTCVYVRLNESPYEKVGKY